LRDDGDVLLPAAAFLKYGERCDGWTAGRRAACLAHLADHGVVADAVRAVGMSPGGAYALRRKARGYAFNLGWEAALLVARRIVADQLMTAAIKGEEACWVREDGTTTYTRQNTKLSMSLLDRVIPVESLTEVLAVVARFDWFLRLTDSGASAQDLWEMFFDDAIPRHDIDARERVRAGLLLSDESAGFDRDWDDDAPIEYKSMDGPPVTTSPFPLGEDMEAWDRSELAGIGERFSGIDSAQPLTQLHLGSAAAKVSQPSPMGRGTRSPLSEMPALDQSRHHPGRDHQHAAIIEYPDGKRDPSSFGQRPCPCENQQVGGDKGHSADADAVAREVAVPCHRGHGCDKQRVDRGLNAPFPIEWQTIGNHRRKHEHRDREQFLAEYRMHPPVPQEQRDRHNMADRKGNRAPNHVQFQKSIAQGPEGHDGGEQQEFAGMMFTQCIAG
jgi:hypothetical protein